MRDEADVENSEDIKECHSPRKDPDGIVYSAGGGERTSDRYKQGQMIVPAQLSCWF